MFFEKMQTRKNDGFTLVELIVVIAILAILAGIAVPAYSGYIEKANVAADEQLLHAVNIAFLSAAAEHADGTVSNASLSYGGSAGAVTVTGVASVSSSGTPDVDALKTAFTTYYGENNTAAFKTVARLKYNSVAHMFEIFSTVTQQAAVDAYNKSNLAGKTEALANSVDSLAGLLAGRLTKDPQGLGLLKTHMGKNEYDAFMEKYGLTEESDKTEVANATIMYVADKLNGKTATDIQTIMGNNGLDPLLTEFGTIPTAAMIYGVMTGYANSEAGKNAGYTLPTITEDTSLTGLIQTMGQTMGTAEFQTYYNSTEKGAAADMDAFLGAMGVINGYEGDFDLSQDNLFTSDDTTALLESILGANSQ